MQSFFNNNQGNEEERLEELTNTIFETLINDLQSKSRYLSIPPNLRASLRDTVYKLVKIASQQNKLLLIPVLLGSLHFPVLLLLLASFRLVYFRFASALFVWV